MNFRGITLLAACASLGAPAIGGADPPPASLLAPEQLRPGQPAVVKTVFQGDRIEEFEAEIVGVLPGGRAGGDLILARATSERVVKSGVALGMSGSPVYVDGKLVGALSSAWPFSREPLFGVTPIREMLDVLEQPTPRTPDGTAGPAGVEIAGSTSGARFGEFRWDDARDPPAAPGPAAGAAALAPTRLALPLAGGGLHPGASAWARDRLAPFGLALSPGGAATGGGPAPASLEPGSAVAIEVMRGDLLLAAIGTVTYREGDRVLLFGHPLFQSGDVRLPLATAEIVTVVPNQISSFKLGVRGRPAGIAEQDRRTAVAGRLGGVPRLLPVSVAVSGAGPADQRFRFESIEDRALAPLLVAIAALNGLLESGGTGANQTVRWALRLHRADAPPLALADVAAGDSPAAEFAEGILAPLRFLFNNPFGRLALDSVAIEVRVEPGRERWTLRSVRVLDAAVRPGGRVRIRAEIERWRGGRETREIALDVPAEAPDGRYTLWAGGASELARHEARLLPGRYRPTSLDDAWSRLDRLRPSDGLYAALFAQAPEVTSEGRDYPELPLSALAVMTGGTAGDRARRGNLAKLDERRLPIGGPMQGELMVLVTVDSAAP